MAALRDPGGPREGHPAARAPVEAARIEIDSPYRGLISRRMARPAAPLKSPEDIHIPSTQMFHGWKIWPLMSTI